MPAVELCSDCQKEIDPEKEKFVVIALATSRLRDLLLPSNVSRKLTRRHLSLARERST